MKKKGPMRCAVCAAILFAVSNSAVAQDADETNAAAQASAAAEANITAETNITGQTQNAPAERYSWLERYLPYERRVAGWVDNTARGIDQFFGTDDAWRVDNESYLRVTNSVRWDEGEGVNNKLRPRLKLDLPTASKRLRLLVESDAPEQRTAAEDAIPGAQTSEDRRRTTVLGVGTNFEGWFPEWKKQLQSGVRVRLPLDPYVRFIARRDIPLTGKWELNSYNRLAWFNSDGYSAKSAITIGEPIAANWRLFYSTNFAWREENDYLEFAQSANLAQVLSSRSAITYTAGFGGLGFSDPHIANYFLAANYRRNVSRKIVFIDVIPEMNFTDANDFKPRLALTLQLELYFQKKIEADD
ncbi:MAG: hypothetical protein QM709_01340 [Spongiibacteraceae bacterium]